MAENDGSASPHDPIPLAVADRLLDLLSSEDDFRALFASNREAALIKAGLDPRVAGTVAKGDCMGVHKLASKEEFAAARAIIIRHLCGTEPQQHIHNFDAGVSDRVVRRTP